MKRCAKCFAPLQKGEAVCPKCGAKNDKRSRHKKETAMEDAVIRVSAADVLVHEYAPLLTEEKSPEQLLEEERAYLEDREPVILEPQNKRPDPITLRDLLLLEGPCMRQNAAPRIFRLCAALFTIALLAFAVSFRQATGNPTILFNYAVKAIAAQNYEGAIATLDRLLILDADNPEVYYQLVVAHQAIGNDAKAFAAAQSGYENTLDDRLRKIVTEYTFGTNPRYSDGSATAQSPQVDAEEILPAGFAEDTITALTAEYEEARPYENGLACVRKNGLWGIIDHTGEWICPPIYDEMLGFSDSLCAVKRGGVWGYIDMQGNEQVSPQYEQVTAFYEGRAAAMTDGLWYVITPRGAVLSEGLDEIWEFSGPFAAARQGKKWGFVDRAGAWAIDPAYEEVRPFHEGLAAVKQRGLWGYIDTAGRTVIVPEYTEAYDFANGIARVRSMDGYLFINPMGWQVGDRVWEDARDFKGGLAAVAVDGLYGFIDHTGDLVIPNQYAQVGDFSQGLCAFFRDEMWGYIDTIGRIAIPPQFLQADEFHEGVARVTHLSHATSYINLAGQYLCDARFEEGGICSQNRIPVKEYGLWGYLAVIKR